jgi:hypothetical protein
VEDVGRRLIVGPPITQITPIHWPVAAVGRQLSHEETNSRG